MRLLRALGAVLVVAGVVLAVASTAAAAPGPPPPYVTDYANYPANAGVPDGCEAPGVTGATFSLNDSPPVGSLGDLPAVQAGGNVVTMTWTGVDPACFGAPLVLVLKDAPAPFFDPNALQPAVSPFEVTTLVTGPGSMAFVLPNLADLRPNADCFYQLDAILGAPLSVVGPPPNGNFYGSGTRGGGPNLLISSKNGGFETCVPTARSTTTTSTTTTAPTTTTTAPSTTTTSAPTTTTPTPPTTEPASLAPAPAHAATTATTAQGAQAAQAQRALAATGTNPWTALAGVAAAALGVVLVAGTSRRARARA